MQHRTARVFARLPQEADALADSVLARPGRFVKLRDPQQSQSDRNAVVVVSEDVADAARMGRDSPDRKART